MWCTIVEFKIPSKHATPTYASGLLEETSRCHSGHGHPTQHVQVQVQVQFNSLKSPHPPVDLTPSRLPPQEPFPSYDHLTVVIISCLPLPSCLT